MDCPQIKAESFVEGLRVAGEGSAYICPSTDGGYTLLALPAGAGPGESFKFSLP